MSQPEASFKERITPINASHWACRDAFYLIRVPYLQLSLSEHQFNIWWADFVTIQSVEWGLRGKHEQTRWRIKKKKAASVNEIFRVVFQFDKLFCIWLSCSVSAGQTLPEAWQTVTVNMCLSYLAFRKSTAMIHNWYCVCGCQVVLELLGLENVSGSHVITTNCVPGASWRGFPWPGCILGGGAPVL